MEKEKMPGSARCPECKNELPIDDINNVQTHSAPLICPVCHSYIDNCMIVPIK